MTRFGITVFIIAVVSGPFYTVNSYSIISNLISELGAQHTQNNFIMIAAFAVLGGSLVIDGVRHYKRSLLPFIFFGLAMGVVGFFPHRPLDASLSYDSTSHDLHGIIASIAGTAVSVGFIWQAIVARKRQRYFCFYMAVVTIAFPLVMLSYPSYQGLLQRIMYVQILSWIWIMYPKKVY